MVTCYARSGFVSPLQCGGKKAADQLQTAAYFAFTASIVLYIYVIQKRASPPEVYSDYFSAATRCQSHILNISEKGSLSERYWLVLEELRVEALRQTERMHQQQCMTGGEAMGSHSQEQQLLSASAAAAAAVDGNAVNSNNYADFIEDATIEFNDIPDSALSDYSGWGQFASMVSSGLGNLDIFFNDDPFKE